MTDRPAIPRPGRPRHARLLVAILVLALAAAACSGGGGDGSDGGQDATAGYDPNAPVSITWWTGQTADAQTLLEKLAADYHAAHPNVTIKASSGAPTTDELLIKLSAGFTGGTYPDISYAYGSWATQLAQSGKTQDIAKAVADPAVKWEEIPAAARATATVDNKVIGIPALVDNLGLI